MSQQPENFEPRQPDSSAPENVVEGNQNRAVQGNDNQAVLGDGNTVNQEQNSWIINTLNVLLNQQTTTPVGNPARPKNERLLLAAVKEEVTARLRQSLHNNAIPINLGKESQPQQVKCPWDAEIKIGLKPAFPLPHTTTILEVFDSQEIAGKLLILGAPGAGKSTTQLELAQALVSRAEVQSEYPVPVLFNLSSWKDDRQSITDWLVTELKSKYGVSTKLGKDWVDNHQLLPLLDGLDELEAQRQELCVNAINQFLVSETRPLYLVVCSRIEEYSNYATQLHLNGAIYLQPLTNNQISDYLTSIDSIKLWSTISIELELLDLVRTPLLLSITVLVSQEISVEKWQHLTSTTDRIQYLLDAYVGQMLTREINSRTYLKNKTPNARQTRIWLVWLAQQMQKESKTEFLIEEMQPNWLFAANDKATYRVGLGLMVGLILGLSAGMYGLFLYSLPGVNLMMEEYGVSLSIPGVVMPGLVSGLVSGITAGLLSALVDRRIFGVICGLVAALITGLLVILINVNGQNTIRGLLIILPSLAVFSARSFWLISPTIETVDAIEFSWFKAQKNLVIWLVVASIYIAVAVNFLHKFYSPQYLLSIFIIFIVIGIFLGGLQKKIEVDTRTIPNQGIKKAAAYSRLFCATFASISGVISWFIDSATFPAVIYIGLTFGLLSGLMLGQGSGVVCIQHFTLRLILYFNGYIPWNYARFLDYCTERLFLQRIGGRYRFIHKLLQDHFAKIEFKRN